jgi:asparagine synthase (glutamine-hydrolysing)
MCGIAAVMGKMRPAEAQRAVQSIVQAQMHRGPDDSGTATITTPAAVLALGNCRLAIQDLSPLGHQPMRNPDTGDVLVYNGELYNVGELRGELEQGGYSFRGHSDTEVLLRAYEHWGRECLKRLRGMFAFCLWDARRQRVLLARDHFGIKPLYYAQLPGGGIVCASEVRSLLASGLRSGSLGRKGLGTYLAYGAVQEPVTIWEGVWVLPRGSWLELDAGGNILEQQAFWTPPQPIPQSEIRLPETLEQGRAIFERAVRTHLVGDVPAGIFLSSGLDSTAILAMAASQREPAENLQAFTVSFPDNSEHDESVVARRVANRFRVPYNDCPVSEQTALRWVREGMQRMDQPSIDGLNTYIVARAVRERGIIMALSGLGSDELFGGYSSFRRVQRFAKVLSVYSAVPTQLRLWAGRALTVFANPVVRGKVRDLSFTTDVKGLYFQSRRLMSDGALARLGFGEMGAVLGQDLQPGNEAAKCLVPGDAIATVARLESMFYMGNTLLRDTDVFSMATSLEARVPFLDQELAEWVFRLPGEVLLPAGAPSKHLLRKLCPRAFSDWQLRQQKKGFSLPFSSWLLGPLRDLVHDGLNALSRANIVEEKGVEGIYRSFMADPHSPVWSRLWALVTLGHWLSQNKVAENYGSVVAAAGGVR